MLGRERNNKKRIAWIKVTPLRREKSQAEAVTEKEVCRTALGFHIQRHVLPGSYQGQFVQMQKGSTHREWDPPLTGNKPLLPRLLHTFNAFKMTHFRDRLEFSWTWIKIDEFNFTVQQTEVIPAFEVLCNRTYVSTYKRSSRNKVKGEPNCYEQVQPSVKGKFFSCTVLHLQLQLAPWCIQMKQC